MSATSYRSHSYWRQYQPFFPPALRIEDENEIAEEWLNWRSASIHVDRHRVTTEPRATVILVHGAGGYGRMFAPLGRFLATLGCEVLAPDLPGYGLSQAPATHVDYASWADLLVELVAAEHARSARPVVLFGASIGGYLAYLCAARSPHVAGLVATTLADPREPMVQRELARNRLLLHAGLPLLRLTDRWIGHWRLPIRWFTHMERMSLQPALNHVVAGDPLGGGNHVPLRLLDSLFHTAPALEPEQFDRCPVLLAHPACDAWTSVAASRLLFDRLAAPKRLVLLENCGHFPIEQPGLQQLGLALSDFIADLPGTRSASATS
jgi:alpha-beta hydrolase superfamily lysophospholipase